MISAIDYTKELGRALRIARSQTNLYDGLDGCLRLAREYGSGLREYPEKEAMDALKSSYSLICVIGYDLKPPINAKEWVCEVTKVMKGANRNE